ncbi:hypothetical protein AGMMS49579_16800 [Spirochaetia bacterium]|nr:hypothetical protein AGMMS49579_16800 [Spirochaetia bacterium]
MKNYKKLLMVMLALSLVFGFALTGCSIDSGGQPVVFTVTTSATSPEILGQTGTVTATLLRSGKPLSDVTFTYGPPINASGSPAVTGPIKFFGTQTVTVTGSYQDVVPISETVTVEGANETDTRAAFATLEAGPANEDDLLAALQVPEANISNVVAANKTAYFAAVADIQALVPLATNNPTAAEFVDAIIAISDLLASLNS